MIVIFFCRFQHNRFFSSRSIISIACLLNRTFQLIQIIIAFGKIFYNRVNHLTIFFDFNRGLGYFRLPAASRQHRCQTQDTQCAHDPFSRHLSAPSHLHPLFICRCYDLNYYSRPPFLFQPITLQSHFITFPGSPGYEIHPEENPSGIFLQSAQALQALLLLR